MNNFFNNPAMDMQLQNQARNQNFYMPLPQHYEIIRVNGEAGARNFRMAPNSNALLLDGTGAVVWLAQTDRTGYLTVTPFDLVPHQQAAQVDLNDLVNRVAQLKEIINAKSNSFSNRPNKKQRQQQQDSTASEATD